MVERVIDAFADWFASKGGLWQTAVVVLGWWGWQAVHGDPNDILLLTVLTVYSAVTQPILAYCSRRAAAKADGDSARILALEERLLADIEGAPDDLARVVVADVLADSPLRPVVRVVTPWRSIVLLCCVCVWCGWALGWGFSRAHF